MSSFFWTNASGATEVASVELRPRAWQVAPVGSTGLMHKTLYVWPGGPRISVRTISCGSGPSRSTKYIMPSLVWILAARLLVEEKRAASGIGRFLPPEWCLHLAIRSHTRCTATVSGTPAGTKGRRTCAGTQRPVPSGDRRTLIRRVAARGETDECWPSRRPVRAPCEDSSLCGSSPTTYTHATCGSPRVHVRQLGFMSSSTPTQAPLRWLYFLWRKCACADGVSITSVVPN
mmetsp:Transcript_40795/g.132641  ORF Transcript_40795/g.132641 Transcript_40795/m.132641 type:complete len:232 (+) Transcript_40795:399-1094(+)